MSRLVKHVVRGLFQQYEGSLICSKRCLNQEGHHMKTEIQMLTHEEDDAYMYIHAYSPMGFLLNSGTRILGPIALFPKSVLHWNVKGAEYIDENSLCLFPMLVPKLEIVVIGYGDKNTSNNNKIFRYLKSHNLNVEILPTDIACSTYNFLNLERRYVAAGLIPPSFDAIKNSKEYYYATSPEEYVEEEEEKVPLDVTPLITTRLTRLAPTEEEFEKERQKINNQREDHKVEQLEASHKDWTKSHSKKSSDKKDSKLSDNKDSKSSDKKDS